MAVESVMATDFTATPAVDATCTFDVVFTEYYSPIYSYVLRMIGNSEDAADLTVTSFEKALRAWPRRPLDLQVRPWLYRIATNTCLDELRHRRLIRWLPLDLFNGAIPHPLSKDDPENAVLKSEEARLVRAALDKLPERYRIALVLRESQGLSCEEIGGALKISRSAAKVLLFRAREKLRRTYFADSPDTDRSPSNSGLRAAGDGDAVAARSTPRATGSKSGEPVGGVSRSDSIDHQLNLEARGRPPRQRVPGKSSEAPK